MSAPLLIEAPSRRQFKDPLLEEQIDISLPAQTAAQWATNTLHSWHWRARLFSARIELEELQKPYTAFRDSGCGQLLTFDEYLASHPLMHGGHIQQQVSDRGLMWSQITRWHSDQEAEYLRISKQVFGGVFVETQQVNYVMDDGEVVKQAMTSLKASKVDCDPNILYPLEPVLDPRLKLIVSVHTHPHAAENVRLRASSCLSLKKIIDVGKPSKEDIVHVDYYRTRQLPGFADVPVFEYVLCTNGLTHIYEAGTSKSC